MPPRPQLYDPFPTVRPQGPRDPSERVHVEFPRVDISGAMGQALSSAGHMTETLGSATRFAAQAMDTAGRQFEHAGDEIFRRAMGLQELQNETAAKKAAIEYDTYAGAKQVEYSQKQGEAADDVSLKAHINELQKKRDETSARMTNPSMKRMFDNATMHTMVQHINSASAHAAKETRKAANGASEARINMNVDTFSKTDDIQQSQRIMNDTYDEFHNTRAPLMGWGRDEAKEEWNKVVERMHGSKIERVADKDPTKALGMLEENKGYLSGKAYTKLLHDVEEKQRTQRGDNIADRVAKQNEDAPLEQKIEEGNKRAEEIAPGDKELQKEVKRKIISDHSLENRERREQNDRDFATARNGVWGYGHPDGKKPNTEAELMAIPGMKEAWANLKPQQKDKIMAELAENAKDDYTPTPERTARFQELDGEIDSDDPAARERAALRNYNEEKIPKGDRDKLYERRKKMLDKAGKMSPSVQRALSVSFNMLPTNLRRGDSSTRNQFLGSLRQALEVEIAARKGVQLKEQEMRDIVSRVLQGVPGTGWFGSTWGEIPRYQQMGEPSDEKLLELKNMFPYMTDEMILDLYRKREWEKASEEYEKLKTKPGAAKPTTGRAPRPAPVPTSQ